MASPSVTYTFSNGTTADATQVNQNFSDLIAAMTDGSKSFSIDALTVAGTATLNGNTILGSNSSDTITVNGVWSGGSASGTLAGLVDTTTQTFAGNKTFTGIVDASSYKKSGTAGYIVASSDVTITGLTTSYQDKRFTLPNSINKLQVISIVGVEASNDIVYVQAAALGSWSGVQTDTEATITVKLGNAVAGTSGDVRVYYRL